MWVVVSVDMEGASGVVSAKQIRENTPQWHEARALLVGDVNAAVEGALAGGADQVVLHDSHGIENINVPPAALHERAQVIYGRPVLLYEQLERGIEGLGEVGCAFLVGYHAGPGVPAILSHLYSWPLLREVRLNGRAASEGAVAAALAGAYGIPTTLVTGDDATCADLRDWCPDIEPGVVKYALSRYAGRCLPLGAARAVIREAAERAVANRRRHRLPEVATPVRLEVQFVAEQVARMVALMPGVERRGPDRVSYTAPDVPAAYRCLNAMFCIATSPVTLPGGG
jgi:D-amino peptidase